MITSAKFRLFAFSCVKKICHFSFTKSLLPKAEQTTRSRAKPTPIRYRGLFLGKTSVEAATCRQNLSFSSPPLRPPIANPGVSLSISSLAHSFRNSSFKPPVKKRNNFREMAAS